MGFSTFISFTRIVKLLLLLTIICGSTSGLVAQCSIWSGSQPATRNSQFFPPPSSSFPKFTINYLDNCQDLEFCVTNIPDNADYVRIRAIGGYTQNTQCIPAQSGPVCWIMPMNGVEVRATFHADSGLGLMFPFGVPFTDRMIRGRSGPGDTRRADYLVYKLPKDNPPVITGIGTDPDFPIDICPGAETAVRVSVLACVSDADWSITPRPESGIQVEQPSVTGQGYLSSAVFLVYVPKLKKNKRGLTSFLLTANSGSHGVITQRVYINVLPKRICDGLLGDPPRGAFGLAKSTGSSPPGNGKEAAGLVRSLDSNDMVDQEVSVFPNPASHQLTVRYPEGAEYLRLMDINGRNVRTVSANNLEGPSVRLQVDDLPTGIYVLDLITKEGKRTIKKVRIGN